LTGKVKIIGGNFRSLVAALGAMGLSKFYVDSVSKLSVLKGPKIF